MPMRLQSIQFVCTNKDTSLMLDHEVTLYQNLKAIWQIETGKLMLTSQSLHFVLVNIAVMPLQQQPYFVIQTDTIDTSQYHMQLDKLMQL